MNRILIVLLMAMTCIACTQHTKEQKKSSDGDLITTYFFIRHAEKDLSDPSNRNPSLTAEGEARATQWKTYFDDKNIEMVYSTNYERTMNTALPTSNAAQLLITNYNPADLYSADFQKATQGKNVVVVGHSNTTPTFVNKVIGENTYEDIDESEYGHLYTVTVNNGKTSVQHKEFD